MAYRTRDPRVRALPLSALIVRQLLVSYRAEPAVVEEHLPYPLAPRLVDGWAVLGLSLVALGHEPGGPLAATPAARTENAAHRVAIEWRDRDGRHAGMYNARRDSDSAFHALAGGRVFPGLHHRAHFDVSDRDGELRVRYEALDHAQAVDVRVATGATFRASTLFPSIEDASWFFAGAGNDYSVTRDPFRLDGVSIESDGALLEPVELLEAHSSVFESCGLFPPGSVHLDSAFLLRNALVQWRALPSMRLEPVAQRLVSTA